MNTIKKSVCFNLDKNQINYTYSGDDYDRFQIDSILYQRGYTGKVSDQEWNNVYITLDIYKMYEMKIHKDSFHNNLYHAKKIVNL